MSAKTILIVDDDEIICHLLQFRLQLLGHQVFFSLKSLKLEKLIEKYNPAILIMDIFMPDKDGIELTRELLSRSPRPFIIAISSHTDYLKSIKKLGADKSYSKNDIESILKAVENYQIR